VMRLLSIVCSHVASNYLRTQSIGGFRAGREKNRLDVIRKCLQEVPIPYDSVNCIRFDGSALSSAFSAEHPNRIIQAVAQSADPGKTQLMLLYISR